MNQLRELQQAQVIILEEVDRVCKKIGVKYTLSCGTALGAIRHKGFIPWDDDIDISMLREDYEKFVKYGKDEFENRYFLQTFETDPGYVLEFAKVRDSWTTMIEGQTENLDINKGIYIDIFPIDKVSDKYILRRIDNYFLSIINLIKFSCTREYCEKSSSIIIRNIRKIIMPISKIIGARKLCYLERKIRTKHNKSDSNITFGESTQGQPAHRIKDNMLQDINIYKNITKVNFENKSFYMIKEYDKYLTSLYGNYMELPPEENRIAHHNIIKLDLNNSYLKYKEK